MPNSNCQYLNTFLTTSLTSNLNYYTLIVIFCVPISKQNKIKPNVIEKMLGKISATKHHAIPNYQNKEI